MKIQDKEKLRSEISKPENQNKYIEFLEDGMWVIVKSNETTNRSVHTESIEEMVTDEFEIVCQWIESEIERKNSFGKLIGGRHENNN